MCAYKLCTLFVKAVDGVYVILSVFELGGRVNWIFEMDWRHMTLLSCLSISMVILFHT